MEFHSAYQEKVLYINRGLSTLLSKRDSHPTVLKAMEYSLQAGGKRIRPVLFLSAYELAYMTDSNQEQKEGLDLDPVLPMACALEMIHTYSLIHDDLPPMDNDDYRRGKPTNHKVFGEAMAILAGDGLLNLAYEVMLEHVPILPHQQLAYIKAMSEIARCVGISGMIGGQSADIENQGRGGEEEMLNYIHTHKTEAFITGSLRAGVLACRKASIVLDKITEYGKAIGLAFQITDDILDLTGDIVQLGKATGMDEKMGKQTYPARYGLDGSKRLAQQYIDEALSCLEPFGEKSNFLTSLATSLLDRKQ